ncbi:transposase [Photorhabdus sp. RM323S]|uniref:transposase n=1 Tax=Photorhabdus sp. RM323S TaxID=3342828 RepID=UPI0036DE310C
MCIPRNRVLEGVHNEGKRFYGFKLHRVINDCGELLAVSSISIFKSNRVTAVISIFL